MKRITVTLPPKELAYLEQKQQEKRKKDGYKTSFNKMILGLIRKNMEQEERG